MRHLGIVIFSFLMIQAGWAEIAEPRRSLQVLNRTVAITNTIKVRTARILIADYSLLIADFPHLANKSRGEIDHWILSNVGFIAETQTRQSVVNTTIPVEKIFRQANRPFEYNRALIFEVMGGLIDGKGFGATNPSQKDHSNGLATSGEVLREYLFEKLVQKIFSASGSTFKTVGSYGVIDWGFDVRHQDGKTSPAGAILRQGHERSNTVVSLLNEKTTVEIEKLLRRYGLTSAGAHRHEPTERLNIQGTSQGEVVDFGGFLALEKFTKIAHAFYEKKPLLIPGSPSFIQPDPTVRVPLDMWGSTKSGLEDPKADNPWIWSHETAEAFAKGKADRTHVEAHIRNFLEPVDRILNTSASKACGSHFQ